VFNVVIGTKITNNFLVCDIKENAALSDEISGLQEKYMIVNEENKFLYSKLEGFNSMNGM